TPRYPAIRESRPASPRRTKPPGGEGRRNRSGDQGNRTNTRWKPWVCRKNRCTLRKQESSRTLDPCCRRGDVGWDHTGIQQACRRTRKRRSSTSFRASRNPVGLWTPAFAGVTEAGVTQESSRPVGARGNGVLQLRKQESS